MDREHLRNLNDIDQAVEQEDKKYTDSCLRVMELMVMQMEKILRDHPEVTEVSFSLDDGDKDSIPVFYCPDGDGNDLGDLPEIEAIAEQWNSLYHTGAIHFISYSCDMTLSRENLAKDRLHLLNNLAQSLPLGGGESSQWAREFDSYLRRRDLQRVAEGRETETGQRNKSKGPGM